MINEDLFYKAFKHAQWMCDIGGATNLPKLILQEYNRLLKIEEALQALADEGQRSGH